jgi:DNA gyrase/topoisomerase IV subunit A
MSEYKDIHFVDRIFQYEFEKGNAILIKCLERQTDNRIWDMFLHSNYDGTFDDYKNRVLEKKEEKLTENLNDEEIKNETDRLVKSSKEWEAIIKREDEKKKNRKIGKEVLIE